MKRLAWLTDIHLNFLRRAGLQAFFDSLPEADAFAITGDIGEARDVAIYLRACSPKRRQRTSSSATMTSIAARSLASGPKSVNCAATC